jgi:hypothetical protein
VNTVLLQGSTEVRRRLDSVDALRGLAIFLVLMNHVNMRLFLEKFAYWQAIPEQLRSTLVWNGQNGVQIFFAISGFLITSTTLSRWGALSTIQVRDFYLLRFARIAPLLLVLLGTASRSVVTLCRRRRSVRIFGGNRGALLLGPDESNVEISLAARWKEARRVRGQRVLRAATHSKSKRNGRSRSPEDQEADDLQAPEDIL